jgi:hypothetical protein
MNEMNMKQRMLYSMVAAAFTAGLMASTAVAKGPPPGKGETTLGNKPVGAGDIRPKQHGGGRAGVTSPMRSKFRSPDLGGPQCTDFPGYWCQKTAATWQAACTAAAATALVTADWGDNLTGGGVLKAGKPIRVEMSLTENNNTRAGFNVIKLTPDLEDRLATYGTDGISAFLSTKVFDSGTRLRIEKLNGTATTIYDGPIAAEINSIGAVVYGFNWGTQGGVTAPVAGTYRITFFTKATTITDSIDGVKCVDGKCTSVEVTLTAGGRGGKP